MFFSSYSCYFLKIIFFCSFLWPFEGFFISAECNDLYPKLQKNTVPKQHEQTIIFMVMGEEKQFRHWDSLVLQSKYQKNIDLVYASYDKKIVCSIRCTLFIPGTTWTEGRNILAKRALENEKKRGQMYDWWGFSDEDCFIHCKDRTIEYQVICFDKVIEKMMSPNGVPNRAVGLALNMWNPPNDFRATSTVDAMFNFYRRSFVPFVLPYVDLAVGESQWNSQWMIFYVMRACAQSSIFIPQDVYATNLDHRKYARGFNQLLMNKTIIRNYPYLGQFLIECSPINSNAQGYHMISSPTNEGLNAKIPCRREIKCFNLTRRFQQWTHASAESIACP